MGNAWLRPAENESFNTLLSIYQSLMFPYLTFGLSAWGQAAQLHLNKLLLLQKRAIRFMNFSKPRTHAVPLFISSKILPINMLYFETMSTLMYDISNNSVPQNISRQFSKSNSIHPYKTRSSSSGNSIFTFNIRVLTNNVIQLHASAPEFGIVCHPKYANCQKSNLKRKFEKFYLLFFMPRTLMLKHNTPLKNDKICKVIN